MHFKVTSVLVAFAIIICVKVSSAPIDDQQNPAATILKYNYEPNANQDGGYTLEFETSDGQSRSETGAIKYVGEENTPVLAVNGVFSYIAPDGVTYSVTYLADENGFQPTGDHIPSGGAAAGSPVSGGQPGVIEPLPQVQPGAIAS